MNGLDLFSGIGGLTRALDGYVTPVAYCELDEYARGVLLSRMSSGDLPVAPIWDDVRTLHPREAGLPNIDIIYGGFPCQDISVAGRGAGLAGERSGLFFEIVRLAKEIKPAFIFLENVPAIRCRGLDRVVDELAALRYDCRWGMLSATDVGANHKRERDGFYWRTPQAANGSQGPKSPENFQRCMTEKNAPQITLTDQVRMWPTPRARDHKGGRAGDGAHKEWQRKPNGIDLPTSVALWPTPRAEKPCGYSSPGFRPTLEQTVTGQDKPTGGRLNPTWVEWLMGYSSGWTVCEPWAMPLSRSKREKRSSV